MRAFGVCVATVYTGEELRRVPLPTARTRRGTMPTSYDTATAELAMTLNTLAYVDENRTATQQRGRR